MEHPAGATNISSTGAWPRHRAWYSKLMQMAAVQNARSHLTWWKVELPLGVLYWTTKKVMTQSGTLMSWCFFGDVHLLVSGRLCQPIPPMEFVIFGLEINMKTYSSWRKTDEHGVRKWWTWGSKIKLTTLSIGCLGLECYHFCVRRRDGDDIFVEHQPTSDAGVWCIPFFSIVIAFIKKSVPKLVEIPKQFLLAWSPAPQHQQGRLATTEIPFQQVPQEDIIWYYGWWCWGKRLILWVG